MKKWRKKIDLHISDRYANMFFVIIGVVLILIPTFPVSDAKQQSVLYTLVTALAAPIGTTLISVSLVSWMIEKSTIMNVVSKAIADAMDFSFPVESYKPEKVHSLLDKMVCYDLNSKVKNEANIDAEISIDTLKQGIYKYERNLSELVTEVYYKLHKMTFHVYPDQNSKKFRIVAEVEHIIINEFGKDNPFRMVLQLFKENEDESMEQCASKIKFEYFKINGKEININKYRSVSPIDHRFQSKYYDFKYQININLEKNVREHRIICKYEYSVPIFDITQSFRITKPTQRLEHKFYLEIPQNSSDYWRISAQAFSTFFHKQDLADSNYKVEQNKDTSVIISYNDWALVGNGYEVVYIKE